MENLSTIVDMLVKVGYLMIFWFLMYSIWNSLHDIRKSTKNSEDKLEKILLLMQAGFHLERENAPYNDEINYIGGFR
jgi:hypothetical protein